MALRQSNIPLIVVDSESSFPTPNPAVVRFLKSSPRSFTDDGVADIAEHNDLVQTLVQRAARRES